MTLKESTKKELIETLKFVGLLIAVFTFIYGLFNFVPYFKDFHTFAIQTGSMDPIIHSGDVVVVKETSIENIEVGDIIAFTVDITGDNQSEVVVHYCDEIIETNGGYFFKTKPHISDQQDAWTLEETDIIGVYKFKIVGIGQIVLFSQSWIGRIVILADIIVISLLYDYLFGKKKKDTKAGKKKNIETELPMTKQVIDQDVVEIIENSESK